MTRRLVPAASVFALLLLGAAPLPPQLLSGLVWRNVGPFRGGRISAASGAIGEVGTFYVGTPAGGVWKTTSGGSTWFPIFDSITSVSSIGAVAVAPSNARVVYVGTGDQVTGGVINEGNGLYKSTDAGRTWAHMGLDSTKQIPAILVDPRNADVIVVAAQGDRHAKSDARGIFRSTDGGASFTRTLFVSDSTGVAALGAAYDRPDVIYATTDVHYLRPLPPSGVPQRFVPRAPGAPTGGALFKSTDGGVTWKELTGGGAPAILGRTSIAVANGTDAQRVYVITNDGLFRSDDGGATWKQMDKSDRRIRNGQGGYNCGVFVDPKDPDVVYTFNTAAYKSTDGGNTFTGFRGAPGGDDPQAGWIDPTNGKRILLGYDQGAIVTYDGGESWSSWYNQSTEQVYHIAVDRSFPRWIYATQQDAGAIRTRARGDLGAVTPLDWSPVNGWEWGTVVPDPNDPNIVYASGNGIIKISWPSQQWISVSPAADPALRLRLSQSQPLVWAPWDPHELMAGFQFLMATTDGGAHWRKISPDLTYPLGAKILPDSIAPPDTAPPRGSIETIAASTAKAGTIWVGTTNGLIKVTRDFGKTWTDASIPDLPFHATALVEKVDADPFHAEEAVAVVDLIRAGDYSPYVYRTRDYGKTWQLIVRGLPTGQPAGSAARVVRYDPRARGLLYLGAESGVFVSFDDGDDWQSLTLNLPTTSYRDFAFAGPDLVVGSYGRGIWVLDGSSVLRQLTPAIASEPVHLFRPDTAWRVRRNVGYNTPFPADVPHALNPPEGVSVFYWLASKPGGEVTLDVRDASGAVVRHMSSVAPAPVKEAAQPPEPNWWIAPPFALPAEAGLNRTHWDLRTDAPEALTHSFEINANPGQTPASPLGAMVPPGTYTLTLTVDGVHYATRVTVVNDPRSPATLAAITAQYALQGRIASAMKTAYAGAQQATAMRAALDSVTPKDSASPVFAAIKKFRVAFDSVAGGGGGGARGFARPIRPPTDFASLDGRLANMFNAQENADHAPTPAMLADLARACSDLAHTAAQWTAVNAKDLPALAAELEKVGVKAPPAAAGVTLPKC